jgi:hypothetical protein
MTASLLATAVVAFLGTTIDDVIILPGLFVARSQGGLPWARSIIIGQYSGFAALLAISLLAATALRIVPDQWVGLLGLVPIGFGSGDYGDCAGPTRTPGRRWRRPRGGSRSAALLSNGTRKSVANRR